MASAGARAYNAGMGAEQTTTWSLSTLDDWSIPKRLHCYRTCYSKVIMKNMHRLTPKVLVTRTVPQSRAPLDNFWFVANVKVYECKNPRLSVLDSIIGLGWFEV